MAKRFFDTERDPLRIIGSGCIIGTVVQIVFIILKLCKVITWSWWLVMLPAIIGFGLFCLFAVFCVICAALNSKN